MLTPPATDASREMLEAYLKLLAEAYQSSSTLARNLQVGLRHPLSFQSNPLCLGILLVGPGHTAGQSPSCPAALWTLQFLHCV